MTHQQAVDAGFLDARARVIDIAAFLDRLERCEPSRTGGDFRVAALRQALSLVSRGGPDLPRRVLELLSDHSIDPIDRPPMQGAVGCVPLPPGAGAGAP